MKPPPMKRLTMAVGKMMKAASIRNLRNIIMMLPTRTKPNTIPSMKLNDPSEATHGKKELHQEKKLGDRRATALAIIKQAAIATVINGSQPDILANRGIFGYGPYHPAGLMPPPLYAAAPIGGASGAAI